MEQKQYTNAGSDPQPPNLGGNKNAGSDPQPPNLGGSEKKMSLQEWSMHYRQIIILLVSCLVALGIYGLVNINKNEFPDFTIRQGIVVAVYPGVTAQEMEEQVTKPLEKYIFTYKEVKKEKTVSYITIFFILIFVDFADKITQK